MNHKAVTLAIIAGAAVVLTGVGYARRSGVQLLPPTRFAPLGFSWNAQVGAYTRVNAQGVMEYVL